MADDSIKTQLEYEILLFLSRLEHPQPAMYPPSADSTPMQKELQLLILPYVCTIRYSAPNDSQGKEPRATDSKVGTRTTNTFFISFQVSDRYQRQLYSNRAKDQPICTP